MQDMKAALRLSKLAQLFGVSVDYLVGNETVDPTITDRDLQVALFGSDKEVTDEMWEEVKKYVNYVKFKHIETKTDIERKTLSEIHKAPAQYIYRAARSADHAEPEVIERDDAMIEKLKNAKKVTSDDDL